MGMVRQKVKGRRDPKARCMLAPRSASATWCACEIVGHLEQTTGSRQTLASFASRMLWPRRGPSACHASSADAWPVWTFDGARATIGCELRVRIRSEEFVAFNDV